MNIDKLKTEIRHAKRNNEIGADNSKSLDKMEKIIFETETKKSEKDRYARVREGLKQFGFPCKYNVGGSCPVWTRSLNPKTCETCDEYEPKKPKDDKGYIALRHEEYDELAAKAKMSDELLKGITVERKDDSLLIAEFLAAHVSLINAKVQATYKELRK